MPTSRLAQSRWQALNTLFDSGALGTLPDPDLLRCFRSEIGARSQEAFRILVERHGPMVLSLCRSLIPDSHEAEDAFQATFLVLVRKGHTIWVRDSVAPWLYGVATKVARRARRRTIAWKRFHPVISDEIADLKTSAATTYAASEEIAGAIHDEVALLPAGFREAIVLCAFEGLTYHAAARQLGVPEPTLRGRLRRARHELEARLRKRGIAAGMPAAPLAGLPAALVHSTVQHAAWWKSMTGLIGGSTAIPASIAVLARGAIRSMRLAACKAPALVALLAGGVLAAAVWAQTGEPPRSTSPAPSKRSGKSVARAPAVAPQPQPAARPGARVISGRLTDSTGRPVRGAKVMFAPKTPLAPFEQAGVSVSDADGRYRIELPGFPIESETIPATDALRYLVLAQGLHSEVGSIDAGNVPVALDFQLSSEEWASTEIRVVDRDGKPVAGADVTFQLGGDFTWSQATSDSGGRCSLRSPRTLGISISVRRDGFLPTRLGVGGTAKGPPKSLTVSLYEAIQGKVVDEAGKPLAGIKVGRLIGPNYDGGLDKPSDYLEVYRLAGSKQPVITDSSGGFHIAPRINLDNRTDKVKIWPLSVVFTDAEFRRVQFLRVDVEAPRKPYEIVLRPARHVRIPIEHVVTASTSGLESWWELNDLAGQEKPSPGLFMMQGLVKQERGASSSLSQGDWIDAYWPVGRYRIQVNSAVREPREGAEETSTEIVVPPGDGPLLLPAIRMKALPLRELLGKPAPEIDAKDLNTGAPVKLADHKGRVIVLDFWGYWCGPCIGSMPALMEAFDKFKHEPVTIIALHDRSIQSRADYDRRLSEVKRQAWGNRELPFQVALDQPDLAVRAAEAEIGGGITCNRYQIQLFPTTLVIDQEGKVAGEVNVREKGKLEAMLNKLLKKSPKK